MWLGQAWGQSSEGPALTGKSDTSLSFMALSEMRRFYRPFRQFAFRWGN